MSTGDGYAGSTEPNGSERPGDTAARVRDLPAEVHRLCTLPRIDYFDGFRTGASHTQDWTATRWACHVLAGATPRMRAQLVTGWLSLGLRINPLRSGRVLGWPVASESPDHVVLAARSPLGMSAQLVFARHQSAWWFGTFLTLDGSPAHAVWSVVRPVHLTYVSKLLTHAAQR